MTLGALVMAASLASCAGASNDDHAEHTNLLAANGSVAYAKSQLGGATPPTPAPFQQALLDKPSLTYADYESAMQAMARCVEQRVPGSKYEFRPSEVDPRMLDSTYIYVAPGSDGPTSLDAQRSPGAAPSPTTSDDGSATDVASNSARPANLVANDRKVAQCQLEYSAYVEDKWQAQHVLTAAEEKVQKPQFLKCLTDAGVKLPADTSDSSLGKWLATPEWFAGLSDAQAKQAENCTTDFVDLTNTFAK